MPAAPLPHSHAPSVSDTRLGGVRELGSGIDALYLSGRSELPLSLYDALVAGKAAAQAAEEPVPFEFGGHEFRIKPGSMGKYAYSLVHPNAQIGITTSKVLPTLRVQARSEFLHGMGSAAALESIEALCALAVGDVSWSLGRLDLFCDAQGWMPTGDDRHRFVCRARARNLYEEDEALSGFVFGRRQSKTIMARVYDKTRQSDKNGSDWWFDVWGDRFDPAGGPVLRVEFELNRVGLTEFGIDQPREGLDAAPSLWAACTDWLTFRSPTADSTKSRWPLAPEWTAISGATLRGDAVGLARVRAGRRKGSLRKLTPPLVGYLARLASIVGTRDLDSTLGAAHWIAQEDEIRRHVTFSDRIAQKVEEDASR